MPSSQEDPTASKAALLSTEEKELAAADNPGTSSSDSANSSAEHIEKTQTVNRGGWDNKVQYILAQIGFAVGLGNVWRFPYLCQKNGGGAFLIPYCIMLLLEGVPLFYLEIAIGQHLKRGSVGVWNKINPYLGGVGIASMVVCFLISLYYNVIISWALFYFFNSFQSPLPWADCPKVEYENSTGSNDTIIEECKMSSATSYFWYRDTLDISQSIDQPGHVVWRMSLCLLAAWCIVFIGMFKGIKSSGKVMYFSATFPYFVLLIYFFRGITLEGAFQGLAYMFTPKMERLLDAAVWRDAATQIFFSLGLGFGGVIAYSSYNDVHNNCKKDAIIVSIINCATSVFATVVIFCVLGFKAHNRSEACYYRNIKMVKNFYHDHAHKHSFDKTVEILNPQNFDCLLTAINFTIEAENETYPHLLPEWNNLNFTDCNIQNELKEAVSGPGLAFIAFTEAMINLPGAPFWSIMFFLMLINLGLGSMFGTLEGIITPLKDLGLKISKELIAGLICILSLAIGQVFTLRSGLYVLDIFDTYAGTVPLLMIAFFETIAVAWIYGFRKFSADIKFMLGEEPGWYWHITWRFLSPLCMFILFIASILSITIKTPQYKVYDRIKATDEKTDYPGWAIFIIVFLILLSIIWIPIIAFLRYRGISRYEETSSKEAGLNSSDVQEA